jgi:NAD(P)-dependent dehydrogenase (short-subunit alcohol dehydrogenase family)
MKMSADLIGIEGHVAIVTGGGRGAGRGIATQLARAGAQVAVSDLYAEAAGVVAEELRIIGGQAVGLACDARDATSIEEMVARVRSELGPVRILVNNVGNYGAHRPTASTEIDWDFWQTAIDQNLRTTFLCSTACARVMQAEAQGGAIVNIASLSGVRASPLMAPYGAVKAGVIQLTQTLALEWARDRIRVNCVAPTGIEGPSLSEGLSESAIDAMRQSIPLGELCTPESLGDCVLMLASRLARFVTGQTVMCDGGASLTTQRAGVAAVEAGRAEVGD